MQKFLNEQHILFSNDMRKPICQLALFLFIAASITMTVVAILSTNLSLLGQNILLGIGIICCCFIIIVLGVPFIMRLVLNCLFRTRPIRTGIKNLPLSYIPPPPNSPAPRWALKSFRETMAQRGTPPSLRI